MGDLDVLTLSKCLFTILFIALYTIPANASTTENPDKWRDCGRRRFHGENGGEGDYIHPYRCPFEGDPVSHTRCCENPPSYGCCLEELPWWTKFDMWWMVVLTTLVIVVLLMKMACVIVCCCWDRCPLYLMCRREATPDYLADPDDMASLSDTMPAENSNNVRIYHFISDKRDQGDFA